MVSLSACLVRRLCEIIFYDYVFMHYGFFCRIKESNYDGSLQKKYYELTNSNLRPVSIIFAENNMYLLSTNNLNARIDRLSETNNFSSMYQIEGSTINDLKYFSASDCKYIMSLSNF